MSRIAILSFAIFLLLGCKSGLQQTLLVPSPNEKIAFHFANSTNGPYYFVTEKLNGDTLVEYSNLGIELSSSSGLMDNKFRIRKLDGDNQNLFNHRIITFFENDSRVKELEVKVFDHGIGFRYVLRNYQGDTISHEATSFNLPDGNAWIQPYDKVTKWGPAYEQSYLEVKVGEQSPNEEGWCFPILSNSNNHYWYFISESGLDVTYHGMHLQPKCKDGNYSIRNPEDSEAYTTSEPIIIPSNQWQSPWRFITISDELADIYKSNLVNKLSPEPKGDFSWVEPGKSSWSWWSDHESSKDPIKLKKFIDLASELNWEYSLIDANWDSFSQDSLFWLIDYAKEKDVGIWLWYNSGGSNNTVTEAPRDKMSERKVRRKEFEKLKNWGIKGVKIDFFQSDKNSRIRQYIEILEDAAEYDIMVNFHGCTLPRGWSKTYPHLLTMEAVRGAETYSFNKQWVTEAPKQNTIYPFTRNLVGPMDYTPVTISEYPNGRSTTKGHELALSVVFESYIQHFADAPEHYLNLDSSIINFLKTVPTTWDEAALIEGIPGQYIVVLKEKEGNTFIAGLNGTSENIKIQLNLNDYFEQFPVIIEDVEKELISKRMKTIGNYQIEMDAYGGFIIYEPKD